MLLRSTAKTTNKQNLKLTPKETPPKKKKKSRKRASVRTVGANIATTVDGGVISDNGMILCESSTMDSTEALFGSEYGTLICDRGLDFSNLKGASLFSASLSKSLPSSSDDGCPPKFSPGSLSATTSSGSSEQFHSANSNFPASSNRVVKTENTSPKRYSGIKETARMKWQKSRTVATQTLLDSPKPSSHRISPVVIPPGSVKVPMRSSSSNTLLFGSNLQKMLVPPGSMTEDKIRPKTLQLKFSPKRDRSPFTETVSNTHYTSQYFNNFMGSYSASVTGTIKHFLDEIEHSSPYAGANKHEIIQNLSDIEEIYRPEHPPPPPAYCQDFDKIININVGGENYFIKFGTLRQYPETLLGSDQLFDFYVEELQCFFFDRNRFLFDYILQYYQTGSLNIPSDFVDTMTDKNFKSRISDCNFSKIEDLLRLELEFFKIHYEDDRNKVMEEEIIDDSVEAQRKEAKKMLEGLDPEVTRWMSRKLNLYLFLTNPQSSNWAAAWMVLDYVFVLFSVIVLFIESEDRFIHMLANKQSVYARLNAVMHGLTQAFFTVDFCLRLIAWPSKNTMRGVKTFLTNGNNICDLISLMPFYLPQLISLLDNRDVKSLVVLRIIRTLRITRIFRVVRHSSRLQFIFEFLLCNNVTDIFVLCELFLLMLIVFSSLIYFVEDMTGHPDIFSIPSAMWWAVVTLTGIGYGDVVPLSAPGRIVAGVAIMSGMIFLALPLAIILHEFAKYMKSKGVSMWSGMDKSTMSRSEQSHQRIINSN